VTSLPSLDNLGDRPVAYVTDLEGSYARLEGFCRRSPYVDLDERGRLSLASDATFVFGGDAIDRGPSSRRIAATLLDAKYRYPERVILLAGNRDINKLRLSRELSGEPPSRAPSEVRGDLPTLLRWILENTMGAKGAFGFRLDELRRDGGAPEDMDVVRSFLDDLRPDGPFTDYLAACQLAVAVGPTLFVHGGVTEENLGTVPGIDSTLEPRSWIEHLNVFYRTSLEAYREGRRLSSGETGWAELVRYQAPTPGLGKNQRSVVYGRTCDATNNLVSPPESVRIRLGRVGLRRVVLGHTPMGDVPSFLRSGEDAEAFETVCADTSRGRLEDAPSLVLEPGGSLSVVGTARLDDGRDVDHGFTASLESPCSPLGMRLRDTGHDVRSAIDAHTFLASRTFEGYRSEQVAVKRAELEGRGLVPG
jgi:hypothetical protein